MFMTIVLIAAPILFILCGALAALSLGRDPEEAATTAAATGASVASTVEAQTRTELFKPAPRVVVEQASLGIEELLASIENHVRTEREAAKVFVHRPSAEALWIN